MALFILACIKQFFIRKPVSYVSIRHHLLSCKILLLLSPFIPSIMSESKLMLSVMCLCIYYIDLLIGCLICELGSRTIQDGFTAQEKSPKEPEESKQIQVEFFSSSFASGSN